MLNSLNPTTGPQGDQYIDVLQNDKGLSYYFDYQQTPSIFINDELVRGIADPELAVGAICDSMESPISECSSVHRKQAKHLTDLYEQREREMQSALTLDTIFFVLMLALIFMGGLWFFRRMIKREFDRDIERFAQTGIAEYHRIREDGSASGRGANGNLDQQTGTQIHI